jgi:hypothetical protein
MTGTWCALDRNEVGAANVGAINAEVLDFTAIAS